MGVKVAFQEVTSEDADPQRPGGVLVPQSAISKLDGRDYVDPEDVRSVLHSIMRHRLILTYDALADHISPDDIVDEIVTQVAVG